MEFGVQIEPQFGFSLNDVLKIAEAALKNGFSSLWFSDHFMLNAEAINQMLLDPWLLMAALVQINSKIRVGSLVFCQSYRNPALTAKMAATLDVLSNGRFDFGIGAGWKELEYKAYGYPFPSAKTRIDQLADAIQIIRGLWTHPRFSFKGKYYQVNKAPSCPKPVQEPMPIWVGAVTGLELMLRVTAKYGDGINLAWAISPTDCQQRFKRLTTLCRRVRRDASEMKKSVGLWTHYFDSKAAMEAAYRENAKERGMSVKEYRERMSTALWGTQDLFVGRLHEYETLGLDHMILMLPHQHEVEQIVKIGTNVLSRL